MRTRGLAPAALVVLATACTGGAGGEALESLKSRTISPKFHSGFWAGEAGKQTALWKKAQRLCRAQEANPTPNCRVVLAVHQDKDAGDRLKAWIRGGTRELCLPTGK